MVSVGEDRFELVKGTRHGPLLDAGFELLGVVLVIEDMLQRDLVLGDGDGHLRALFGGVEHIIGELVGFIRDVDGL